MRLIDADALHDDIVESYMMLHKLYEAAQDEQAIKNMTAQLVAFAEFAMRVKAVPTIDAEPMRRGRWVKKTKDGCWWHCCSECGDKPLWGDAHTRIHSQ